MNRNNLNPLILGTAQIGLPRYGIANERGNIPVTDALQIVQRAAELGVDGFDTAVAYGEAESLLGRALSNVSRRPRIITKISSSQPEVCVQTQIQQSCERLGCRRLDIVLIHGWKYRHSHEGALWNSLVASKQADVISKIGASIDEPWQAMEALKDPAIEVLQIPINILDWRWREFGAAVRGVPHLEVHARSIFLQGLLFLEASRWPAAALNRAAPTVELLHAFVAEHGCKNLADLAIRWVRSIPWIHKFIIGVETLAQLNELSKLLRHPPFTQEEALRMQERFGALPEHLLIPSRW